MATNEPVGWPPTPDPAQLGFLWGGNPRSFGPGIPSSSCASDLQEAESGPHPRPADQNPYSICLQESSCL